jgi:hypothetical protein
MISYGPLPGQIVIADLSHGALTIQINWRAHISTYFYDMDPPYTLKPVSTPFFSA